MRCRILLFVVFCAALAPAGLCQSGNSLTAEYVGKAFVLHGYWQASFKVKAHELGKKRKGCDAPVEVKGLERKKKDLVIKLERIGQLVVEGKSMGCTGFLPTGTLTISGIAANEPDEKVRALLDQMLKTPEAYLAARGIAFDLPPAVPATPPVERLGPGSQQPRPLLTVTATYSEEARMARVSGVVLIRVMVGADGRIHNAAIIKGVGAGLDQQALRVLPLWRYLPARINGQPVSFYSTVEMNFRVL